jgi:hypothetical protein
LSVIEVIKRENKKNKKNRKLWEEPEKKEDIQKSNSEEI